MAWRQTSKFRRAAMRVVYTILGVYVLGYFPAYWLPRSGGRQIAMVLLALLAIPFGTRSSGPLRGLLTGLGIGLWGGLWTVYALINKQNCTERAIWVSILGTAFMCTAVCGLFSYMAGKRRKRIDRQWQ